MDSLIEIATEFRAGILEGRPSQDMCFAICAPLQSYLEAVCALHTELEEVDFGFSNHLWLRLEDGRILDPTADQFSEAKLPPVYLGRLPRVYRGWIDRASKLKREDPLAR